MHHITCPGCGFTYQVSSKLVGKAARCKKCDHRLTIAAGGAESSSSRPTSAASQGRDLFAGMNLEEMLGPKTNDRPAAASETRGFMLPEERAAAAAVATSSQPLPTMIIEGLSDTGGAIKRPRVPSGFTAIRTVLPRHWYGGDMYLSPMGLLLIVNAFMMFWLTQQKTNDPDMPGWVMLLPLILGGVGLLMVIRAARGHGARIGGRFGQIIEYGGSAIAAALAIGILSVWISPASSRTVAIAMIPLAAIGGTAYVVGCLWSLIRVINEGIGCLLMIIFVPCYGLYYLISRWQDQRHPFGIAYGGVLIAVVGLGVFGIGTGHWHNADENAVAAMAHACPAAHERFSAEPDAPGTSRSVVLLADYVEFGDFAFRPPAGWVRATSADRWAPTSEGVSPINLRGALLYVEPFAELPKDGTEPPRKWLYGEMIEDRPVQINNMPVQLVRLKPTRAIRYYTLAYLFNASGLRYQFKLTWDDSATPEQVTVMQESAATLVRRTATEYAPAPSASQVQAWDEPPLPDSEVARFRTLRLHVPHDRVSLQTDSNNLRLRLTEGEQTADLEVFGAVVAIRGQWPLLRIAGPHVSGVEGYSALQTTRFFGMVKDRNVVMITPDTHGAGSKQEATYLAVIDRSESRGCYAFNLTLRGQGEIETGNRLMA